MLIRWSIHLILLILALGMIFSSADNQAYSRCMPPPVPCEFPESPRLLDVFGNPLENVYVGQEVVIERDIQNRESSTREFFLLVQIKTQDGYVEHLSWIGSVIQPSEYSKLKVLWAPIEAQTYTVEAFVWDTLDEPRKFEAVTRAAVSVEQESEPTESVNDVNIITKGFVGNPSYFNLPIDFWEFSKNVPIFLKFRNEANVHLTVTNVPDNLFVEIVPSAFNAKAGHRAAANLFLENVGTNLNDVIIVKAIDDDGKILASKEISVSLAGDQMVNYATYTYNPTVIDVEKGKSSFIEGYIGVLPINTHASDIKWKIQMFDPSTNSAVSLPNWLSLTPFKLTEWEQYRYMPAVNFTLKVDVSDDAVAGKYVVIVTPGMTGNDPSFHFVVYMKDGIPEEERLADIAMITPSTFQLRVGTPFHSMEASQTQFPVYLYSSEDTQVKVSASRTGDLFAKVVPDTVFVKAGEIKRIDVFVASMGIVYDLGKPPYDLRLIANSSGGSTVVRDLSASRFGMPANWIAPGVITTLGPSWFSMDPDSLVTVLGSAISAVDINSTLNFGFDLKYYDIVNNTTEPLPEWLHVEIIPHSMTLEGTQSQGPQHVTPFLIKIKANNAPIGQHLLALETNANATSTSFIPMVEHSGLLGIGLNITESSSIEKEPALAIVQGVEPIPEENEGHVRIFVQTYSDVKNVTLNLIYGVEMELKSMKQNGTSVSLSGYKHVENVPGLCYGCGEKVLAGTLNIGDIGNGQLLIFDLDFHVTKKIDEDHAVISYCEYEHLSNKYESNREFLYMRL